jgi:magnesium-transporting ATPase (P-type)
MTVPWPNAASASIMQEAEVNRPATVQELACVCLARAKFVLSAALISFAAVVLRLALGLHVNFDYSQSDQAYETLQRLTLGLFVLQIVLFALALWVAVRSAPILSSASGQRIGRELWKRDAVTRWITGILATGAVVFITTYFVASWLEASQMVSRSIESAIQIASHVGFGVICIVVASLQIKQAINIASAPVTTE